MSYHARWIGYEEGHQKESFEDFDGYLHPIYHWIEDFYIRIDTQALRIGDGRGGVNLFWDSIFSWKRNRVFRSGLVDAWQILKRRLKGGRHNDN